MLTIHKLAGYNLSTRTIVYEVLTDPDPDLENNYGTGQLPIIHQNRVYCAVGLDIICHDLLTGKQIWSKRYPSIFSFSGLLFLPELNRLYANCENQTLYCLDPLHGNHVWTELSSGTSSQLTHHNGVIYFTGGGDGLLHAVDAQTGTHIWKAEAPFRKKDDDAFFEDGITIDPQTNRIYAYDWVRALCFNTAR